MRKRAMVANIFFGGFLILGSISISSCSVSTSHDCLAWELNTNGNTEGWQIGQGITLVVQDGYMRGKIAQPQSYWLGPENLSIDATFYKTLRLRYRVNSPEAPDAAYFYWVTADDPLFKKDKRFRIDIQTNNTWQETSIDLTPIVNWNGTITGIQLYPAWVSDTGVTVQYDYIRLCR